MAVGRVTSTRLEISPGNIGVFGINHQLRVRVGDLSRRF